MATDTWDNDDGTWADWNVHWAAANWTNATPIAAIVPTAANVNWKNNTFATTIPAAVTRDANINLRWRVEPAALPTFVSLTAATINWRNITNPAALALSAVTEAQVNWRNYTNTVQVIGSIIPRAAKINERWRVEPVALGPLAITRNTLPGTYVFSGDTTTTTALDVSTVIGAFVKWGPWPDTAVASYIDILAQDCSIKIRAEDRGVQVQAEDRSIRIPADEQDIVSMSEDQTITIRI